MVTVPSHLPRRLPPAIGPRLVIAAASLRPNHSTVIEAVQRLEARIAGGDEDLGRRLDEVCRVAREMAELDERAGQ